VTPEDVVRIRELLANEDPNRQHEGLALAQSFDDYSAVFEGCRVTDNWGIELSFGSLNNSILKGLLGSGVISAERIASITSSAASEQATWSGWVKRACVATLSSEQYPALWSQATELIKASDHAGACKLLEPALTAYWIYDNFDFGMANDGASEFLELTCGLTLERIQELNSGEEFEPEQVHVTKVYVGSNTWGGGSSLNEEDDLIISASASFRLPAYFALLEPAFAANDEPVHLDTGLVFQWQEDVFEDEDAYFEAMQFDSNDGKGFEQV
jgi:hypothetical protein